jgi:hypothetical protein
VLAGVPSPVTTGAEAQPGERREAPGADHEEAAEHVARVVPAEDHDRESHHRGEGGAQQRGGKTVGGGDDEDQGDRDRGGRGGVAARERVRPGQFDAVFEAL